MAQYWQPNRQRRSGRRCIGRLGMMRRGFGSSAMFYDCEGAA